MNDYFDNRITYKGISFQLTNKPTPDEREIHTYHEILYYMSGEAELLTEKRRYELNKCSLLIIPKGSYHFIRLNNGNFLRLKISISETSEEKLPVNNIMKHFKLIDTLPDDIKFSLGKLFHVLQNKESEKSPFYAYAAFMMLIAELDVRSDETNSKYIKQDGIVAQIIKYVSNNLSGDLSINALSRVMNISPSGIKQSFKTELGISLHNYITQRRMIYARELIMKGHKPSKIYLDCGYIEYSSFYRAYTKFFGYSPSKDKI